MEARASLSKNGDDHCGAPQLSPSCWDRDRRASWYTPGSRLPLQQPRRGICLFRILPDDDWTDEFPPDDPELEDQFGSLEAADAYAVTEFKNASSDMKNTTRTFMEAKDLVSRVKHARGYFPVVGVGAFDGFQTTTPRGSRQPGSGKGASTGMNSQTSKGRGRGLGKKEHPSRFSTSIASQIQSDINRNCEGRTGTWNSNSTRSVFTLSTNGTSGSGLSESWDA